jgi:hypothetical protein
MITTFESVGLMARSGSLVKELIKAMPTPEDVEIFRKCLRAKEADSGECIIQQGQRQAGLYMIESGQVSILLESADGSRLRLHTLGNRQQPVPSLTGQPACTSFRWKIWVVSKRPLHRWTLRCIALSPRT